MGDKRIILDDQMSKDHLNLKSAIENFSAIMTNFYTNLDKVDEVKSSTKIAKGNYLGFNKKESDLHTKINCATRESFSEELYADLATIEGIMTNTVTTSKINDNALTVQITERINELEIIQKIIKEYDETISNSGDLSNPSTLANLTKVRSTSGINDIAGAIEAKQNRLKNRIGNKYFTDAELAKMIKEIYGEPVATDNMEEFLKYARYTMLTDNYLVSIFKLANGKSITDFQGLLVQDKDGKWRFVIKSKDNKWSATIIDLDNLGDGAYFSPLSDVNPKGTGSVKGNNSKFGAESGINIKGGNKQSFVKMEDNDGNSVSFANVNAGFNASQKGFTFGLDANLVETNTTIIFHENDLYYYQTELGVSALSASVGGTLTTEGFKLKTPGLVSISVGIGKVDKIDTDFNN